MADNQRIHTKGHPEKHISDDSEHASINSGLHEDGFENRSINYGTAYNKETAPYVGSHPESGIISDISGWDSVNLGDDTNPAYESRGTDYSSAAYSFETSYIRKDQNNSPSYGSPRHAGGNLSYDKKEQGYVLNDEHHSSRIQAENYGENAHVDTSRPGYRQDVEDYDYSRFHDSGHNGRVTVTPAEETNGQLPAPPSGSMEPSNTETPQDTRKNIVYDNVRGSDDPSYAGNHERIYGENNSRIQARGNSRIQVKEEYPERSEADRTGIGKSTRIIADDYYSDNGHRAVITKGNTPSDTADSGMTRSGSENRAFVDKPVQTPKEEDTPSGLHVYKEGDEIYISRHDRNNPDGKNGGTVGSSPPSGSGKTLQTAGRRTSIHSPDSGPAGSADYTQEAHNPLAKKIPGETSPDIEPATGGTGNDSQDIIITRGRKIIRGSGKEKILSKEKDRDLHPALMSGDGRVKNPKIKTDKEAAKSSGRVKAGKALKHGSRIAFGLSKANDKLTASVNETDEDRDKNSFGLLKDTAQAAGGKVAGKVTGKAAEALGSVIKAAPIAAGIIALVIVAIFVICCGIYAAWVPQTSYTYPGQDTEGESIAQEAVDRITNRLYAYEYNAMYGDAGPYEGADGTDRMAALSSLGKGVTVGQVQQVKFTDGKRSETIKLNDDDSYKGTITKFVQLCMSMATVEKLNNLVGLYDDLGKNSDVQNFYDYAQHAVTLCLDCSTVKDGTWYINVDIGDVIDDETALAHPGWSISFIRLWARSYMTMDDDAWLELMGVEIPERIEYQIYTAEGAGALSGDLATIANYLKSNFGFSNVQVAAIMGNMYQESRYNVAASNRGQYLGLCQWGGGRKTALLSYASSHNGGNWKDLNTQLGYLKQELNGGYKRCVSGLKGYNEVNAATKYWLDIFEGAPGQQLAARQAEARKILSQLESGTLDSGGGSMSSSDYIEVAVAIAANNKYIYVWGGGHIAYTGRNNMPSGFDCSGFVSWCLYKSGYPLKSAFDTHSEPGVLKGLGFKEVPVSQARRGDIIVSSSHTEFVYDSTHKLGAHGIHGEYASTTPAGSAGANYSRSVSGHANSISIRSYNFAASGFRCFRPSNYKKGASAGTDTGDSTDVQQVVLNRTEVTLDPSITSVTLRATVVPAKAQNRAITWKSSNTRVASVSNNGKVTIVGNGTCKITAFTKNGKKAECKVTVRGGLSSLTCTSGINLSVGQSEKISVFAVPAASYTYTWSTSNSRVARIGSDGKVYAVGTGTAQITVSCAGKKAVCSVVVN